MCLTFKKQKTLCVSYVPILHAVLMSECRICLYENNLEAKMPVPVFLTFQHYMQE